jgi:hypothetical protein
MANNIVLKNNQISGIVPSPEELVLGEVAINTADGILYTKTNSGDIKAIGAGAGGDITINSPVQSVAGRIGNVVLSKSDVGLSNVDNTKDIDKPVSNAQALADITIKDIAAQDATNKADIAKNYAIQRSNHTGTQLSSSISDFATAVSSSSPVKSVAGKTGVVTLTKSDIGLSNVDNTKDIDKPVSTAQAAANTQILNAAETLIIEKSENAKLYAIERSNHTGTQAISTISGLQTTLNSKANTTHNHDDRYYTESEVNTLLAAKQASGNYATLVNGLVPSTQLPSYVDDILEYSNIEFFPVTGETGKIYVSQDNNKTYRWAGSFYVEISASPGSTDAIPEGSVNLYYTDSRAAMAAPVKSVAGRAGHIDLSKSDVGLINVDNTSDINKPISNAVQLALDTKASSNHDHSLPNENTKIGRASLSIVTSGNRNTSIGCDAMQFNTTGHSNTALGSPALWQNISGFNNVSVGAWSMVFNTSGSENTAVGTASLTNNVNGVNNIGIGTAALYNNTTGINNTSIGSFAAVNNTTGSNNIFVGFAANVSGNNLSNCIVLGTNATANKSGQLVLGSSLNPINTSSSVGDAGVASPLPSRPLGYLEIRLNNQLVKIPYYN